MSIVFTNSLGNTITRTEIELTSILTNLNAANTYFANASDNLVYIRVSQGNLLLIDLNTNINRKLFELFTFQYDISNPFNLKLVHKGSAIDMTIDNALISVGYSGTTPISTLESIWMKLYTTFSSYYLSGNNLVKHQGQVASLPAELKILTQGPGIVLSNDANTFTITSNVTNNTGTGSEILDTATQSLKHIKAGKAINITSDTNNITINSDLSNYMNAGINLLDTSLQKVKNLISSNSISITESNNAVSFNTVIANAGSTGISLLNNNKIKQLVATQPLTITDNSTSLTLANDFKININNTDYSNIEKIKFQNFGGYVNNNEISVYPLIGKSRRYIINNDGNFVFNKKG